MRTLDGESDRGAVLVGAAFVEHSLAEALHTSIEATTERAVAARETLFGRRGPLSSGWAKTQFALAMEVIDGPLYDAIEIIRVLRNHFAHSHGRVTFADPKAQAAVRDLRRVSRLFDDPPELAKIRRAIPLRTKLGRTLKARYEFVGVVSYIVGYLQAWADGKKQTD